ncbi:Bax inhibitor-1 family protein [Thaumasiovibrio subtropicus]|uniref:Bax inhibitor-1 family protein n=1 Tax=Thaumasiovibrio subtropicus TaxID=1891207 RepID=UPI000B364165|nr:Bax inhibitor-1 family protein [Thaumasiovibrio subtropicus]
MFESDVFERTELEGREISANLYNFTIGLVLCWGFFVNYLMVGFVPVELIYNIPTVAFFIGYFISCFIGIWLFSASDNPIVSFIGYNFVVVPFGFIINMVVAVYDPALVMQAIQLTGMVTGLMMILGTLFPAFFTRIVGALTIALLCIIVVELVQRFVFGISSIWTDWAVALIFCGYIGYDWGRANQIPKTLDNAVDSAAALYMDIINLFLRILRILASRNN